jgi:hypothetical protein
MKEKSKLVIEIIISLIVVVFSAKMIYKRINLYLYGDTVEISEVKKHVSDETNNKMSINEISKQDNIQTDTQTKQSTTTTEDKKSEIEKLDIKTQTRKITIRYQNKRAKNVKIAASFYKWKERDMKKSSGIWYDEVFIKDPGEYKYYFIVDGKKTLDPKAKKTRDGRYSILEIK